MKDYGLTFQRTYNPDDPTDVDEVSILVFEVPAPGEDAVPFASVSMSGEMWKTWQQIAAAAVATAEVER
jgi:hypothetical protein